MKIRASDDWRGTLPFETPIIAAEVVPGDPARCSACPVGTDPYPRTELWAVKHRHPKNHDGDVRFYCAAHVPVFEQPAPVVAAPAKAARTRAAAPRASRPAAERAERRPPVVERPRAVCPNCFVEIPPTGVCGICGEAVAG
ncbi:glucose-6-phosphate dehydrogenase [Microbacterium mangrovi]|uniref:Glucose-6-phosphate dehydrogenase n=1 Tax=Microbacterium mangrovi TaxID=1348253 RepID=A0A0B2A692_9MICO|nr:hypothetical protein [Microbacterium mangrovi]KHK97229.1 glucose-6-phosphate dehydrogenase [Microbacterium mangrovi]